MSVLVHQLLLALAVWALGAAGVRLAGQVSPGGLERMVVAVVLCATAIMIETLGLGLVGLGADPAALTAGTVVMYVAARLLLPSSGPGPGQELRELLARASPGARLALGAAVGVLVSTAIFCAITPNIGVDGVGYHFPEVLSWIDSGHPGRIVNPIIGLPTGWYPLSNEVILTWSMGISRSFVPTGLWMSVQLGLIMSAGWLGLRRLGVAPWTAALVLAAILAGPDIAVEVNTPKNDIASLTWLITCGALVARAVPDRSRLYPIAWLAAALALGSKTTSGPMVVVLLHYGAYRMRAW
ncbi:MAG TPA: hypothetical protein VHX88_22055, partial [Solirubrobacteraceae bacterium]|nr:hypothetical protein [Solirubrobacteraceae bacterium]